MTILNEEMSIVRANVKTSVIIPVYNTKEYLRQCIESVLAQTQKEIEIILVDDGSTDGSTQIIQAYEEKYSVIKAIYQENQKLGAARNAGIKIASGKYVYFLDSDDYIRENLLEECYQAAEKQHLDFVMLDTQAFADNEETKQPEIVEGRYVRNDIVEGNGKVYSGIGFWDRYYAKGVVYSCAYLMYINKNFLQKNNLYFEPGIYYEDMDWMVRMYLCAERIAYTPKQFHYRRYRANSITTAKYNDIHLKSCIVSCRRMMDMLSETQELLGQSMIVPVLAIMLNRVGEIFKVYCKESRLDTIWSDVLGFYRYMLLDIGIEKKTEKVQVVILKVLQTIKNGLQEFDAVIDLSSLDFEGYRRQVVFREFEGYGLDKKEKTVGVYGTGIVCKQFLSMYCQLAGEIAAKVFFIDTNKESGGSFRGYPLYNVKDIGKLEADVFIIASNRYKEDMVENIRTYYSRAAEIKGMPEMLKFFDIS